MSGFKNNALNEIAKQSIYEEIIDFVFLSLKQMKEDMIKENIKIENKEEKIRTHLLEHYLNNIEFRNEINFRNLNLLFNAEVAEGYNEKEESYEGRVDIKVYSEETIYTAGKSYYIIECKRLDGSNELNKKFITEGICRFILDNPKYSSYNRKNIMLGFIVKNINIQETAQKLNEIQKQNKKIHIIEQMHKCRKEKEEFYLYKNKYNCNNQKIELSHMFYNIHEIIA